MISPAAVLTDNLVPRPKILPEPAAAPGPEPWFAIRVKSQYEKITAVAVRNKGYQEFAPMYRSRRFWSDRVKELDLPLFPVHISCRVAPLHRLPVIAAPA